MLTLHRCLVATTLLMLVGCSFEAIYNDRYPGEKLETLINDRYRPLVEGESSELHVGMATCPKTLNLADGHADFCSIPLNDGKMRVRATLRNNQPYVEG